VGGCEAHKEVHVTEQGIQELCLNLLQADHEADVIALLSRAGLWENRATWRLYGDDEMNFSTIGNQQATPEPALVEKIVNSVDARLMLECQLRGINPEGPKAPKTVRQAVAAFFEDDPTGQAPLAGRISEWGDSRRREVAQEITFAATGDRPHEGNPCFTIADQGEGQTPERMPDTLLSIGKKNKLHIQFVQGKFNMGGTGVLKFCGRHNLQFILSRRHPGLADRNLRAESDLEWGFTVVRREDPEGTARSSVYTYLAPVEADHSPGRGRIMHFKAETLPLFPDGNRAYARESKWGTLIKLYEYHAVGAKSHILRADGMLSRFDLLLPELALPVRLHECREGFTGHPGSWATTLTGLSVRLNDDKMNNLEFEPISSPLKAGGETMMATIYAFKKGKSKAYRRSEGIIFTVNGQTHGSFTKDFFTRRAAGSLDYIAESLLVCVDCSGFSGRAREDFIMNSRDRISGGELRVEIERALEDLLKESRDLRALRERRQREATQEKLDDSKPLEEVLRQVFKQSPTLSQLFLRGSRLSDPFRHERGKETGHPFRGRTHPTYFKFREVDYGEPVTRRTPINMRTRLFFLTDAVDNYFGRPVDPGEFKIFQVLGDQLSEVDSFVGPYLVSGEASVSMKLPPTCQVGDELQFVTLVHDPLRDSPFENRFVVTVGEAIDSGPGGGGPRGRTEKAKGDALGAPGGIELPNVIPVYEGDWPGHEPPFTKHTALRLRRATRTTEAGKEVESFDFFINMDNLFLRHEQKAAPEETIVLAARFKYGMVLLGLGLIYQSREDARTRQIGTEELQEGEPEANLPQQAEYFTRAVAPVLLPTIAALGELAVDIADVRVHAGEAM
jgi:hypothetical protein